MPQVLPPVPLVWAAALTAATFCFACASGHPPSVPAYEYRHRLREIVLGQSIEQVHATLGEDPVRRPARPETPIPSPFRVLEFDGPDGQEIRLEAYVIEVWRADGCPDFHYRDAPVGYVDGRVAALDWASLEWNWEHWGGSLADLRRVQDRFRCEEP